MDIKLLPKQSAEDRSVSFLITEDDENCPLLSGKLCDEEPEGGEQKEVEVGDDVCVYTAGQGRPWVGRVIELLPGGKFIIHWFGREGRGCRFKPKFGPSGEPDCNILELDTIMFRKKRLPGRRTEHGWTDGSAFSKLLLLPLKDV